MRDKRSVDELSIEELEQVLFIRKREARMARFRNRDGRRVDVPLSEPRIPAPPPEIHPAPSDSPPGDQQMLLSETTESPSEVSVSASPLLPPVPIPIDDTPRFEDELPVSVPSVPTSPAPRQRTKTASSSAQRKRLNYLLVIVELLSVVGLVGILVLAYQGLNTVEGNIDKTNNLNATAEAAFVASQILPTATPLITVNQVVLPGGHIWNESGRYVFNYEEVPVPYRTTFQEQIEAPRAGIGDVVEGGPRRLQIPDINVDASVRTGEDWITLEAGVGHQSYSSNPGRGNMVLVAHNDIFGEIFKRLDELESGDEVHVQSSDGKWYTYRVSDTLIVEPDEVWVLDQSRGQDVPIATLISCYPYRVDTQRIVVVAALTDIN